MIEVNRMYTLMNDNAAKGSTNFTNTDAIEDFVLTFTKLGTNSGDIVRGSVSYGNLNEFIHAAFTDEQIVQRIADKTQAQKKAKEAAEAEAARIEAEKNAKIEEEAAAAIGDALDDFDVFGDDYGAETAAPAKKETAPPK